MRTCYGRWKGVGLVVLLLLVVLPSLASGATTVRTFSASHYFAAKLAPLAAPPVTVGANLNVHLAVAPGYPAAGVQGPSVGLQGTTVVLPSCARACTDRYRPASSPALAAGDFAERVIFTVTQPGIAGPAVGFDLEIAVHLTTGWVFGNGYLSTGVGTGAAAATVTLRMFVNLGLAAPTVTAVEVTLNRCLSTTGCP